MTSIILLILLGIFLFAVEVFLIPGVTIAGIGALVACGFGVYRAFDIYGTAGGLIVLGIVLILTIIVMAIGLRAKTWQRLTLKENIDGSSQQQPQHENVEIGDSGTTLTRLAPSGKITINGNTYEARSIDVYIDPKQPVTVTGFDNFTIIVQAGCSNTENQ